MTSGSVTFTIQFVYLMSYTEFSAGEVCLDYNAQQRIKTTLRNQIEKYTRLALITPCIFGKSYLIYIKFLQLDTLLLKKLHIDQKGRHVILLVSFMAF